MIAAAAGRPYSISYGGRFGFQYADDAAKAYIDAARVDFQGAEVFNLGGETVGMDDVVGAIEAAEPSARGTITYTDSVLPFPAHIDNAPFVELLGVLRVTPLDVGVAQSIRIFKKALSEGKMAAD
jgi:nucleoside-diphosphate-sugar epimerase